MILGWRYQAESLIVPCPHPRVISTYDRWIDHYTNRITYEKAMLGETGGLAADRFNFEVGGKVLVGDEWLVILKISKISDAISTLSLAAPAHRW